MSKFSIRKMNKKGFIDDFIPMLFAAGAAMVLVVIIVIVGAKLESKNAEPIIFAIQQHESAKMLHNYLDSAVVLNGENYRVADAMMLFDISEISGELRESSSSYFGGLTRQSLLNGWYFSLREHGGFANYFQNGFNGQGCTKGASVYLAAQNSVTEVFLCVQ